ncbi:DUF1643 domain-containing protein [Lactococcus carnosus]|uniref:DUF1643 domain-containing protein n=1 Tax=Pseudolactococcus carnosus TaxID=2749961 RepID=UPI000BD8F91B|nr:DUF1643 domain-containing protein [Lactococcus carnosus]SOB47606.1 conserved hypothetical protein [Lactococcus piscium]
MDKQTVTPKMANQKQTTDAKVTKLVVHYPAGESPDWVEPTHYQAYRFGIGKITRRPLVAICMNPSAARDQSSDRTVNRVISASQKLGYDGWVVFNTYPERATDAVNMDTFDQTLSHENIQVISAFLREHEITEVWGAWGDLKYEALRQGRDAILAVLKAQGIKIFHFAEPTKAGNPRHPLYLKVEAERKRYL